MNIIIGRGKNRKVLELPCAEIVKQAPVETQKTAVFQICSYFGIKPIKDD